MALPPAQIGSASRARPAAGTRGQPGLLLYLIGGLLVVLTALQVSLTGSGLWILGFVVMAVGAVVIIRRPAVGILIYLTTFLFTYPAWMRGAGNLTVNNLMGLILLPMMLYGMLREGDAWIVRFRPAVLLGAVVVVMMASSSFYVPSSELDNAEDVIKIETSRRTQGAALIATRDAGTKFLTRYVFLLFFLFFVRSPRDIKFVVGIVIGCLLLTYFNVSTEAGAFGWGTGRLRVLGEQGAAVYAGRNPNKLAYFALFGLTLLWYGRRAIKSPFMYPLWFAATAITFIMIPMTGSRSGILNLVFFVIILLMEGRFDLRKVAGMAMITLLVIIQFGFNTSFLDTVLPEDVARRLTSFNVRSEVLTQGVEASGSAEGRLLTARAALRIWALHPVFGVGIGNFNTERAMTDPTGTVGPPHNSYLWALAEGGLVTFGLYLSMFVWTFRRVRSIEWEYEARFGPVGLGWLVNALRTALIGFLIFSFFADMWHHVLFYIIIGMCLTVIRMHQVYAETGQVPKPFTAGRQLAPDAAPA
jgi:O-antigen ligase